MAWSVFFRLAKVMLFNYRKLEETAEDQELDASEQQASDLNSHAQRVLGPLYSAPALATITACLQHLLNNDFEGNTIGFCKQFLYPAAKLLERLKKRSREGACVQSSTDPNWPLCICDRITVVIGEPDASQLCPGDFCYYVRLSPQKSTDLVFKYRLGDGVIRQHVVTESQFEHMFSQHWTEAAMSTGDQSLSVQLRNCLALVEKGTERMPWNVVCCSHDACPSHRRSILSIGSPDGRFRCVKAEETKRNRKQNHRRNRGGKDKGRFQYRTPSEEDCISTLQERDAALSNYFGKQKKHAVDLCTLPQMRLDNVSRISDSFNKCTNPTQNLLGLAGHDRLPDLDTSSQCLKSGGPSVSNSVSSSNKVSNLNSPVCSSMNRGATDGIANLCLKGGEEPIACMCCSRTDLTLDRKRPALEVYTGKGKAELFADSMKSKVTDTVAECNSNDHNMSSVYTCETLPMPCEDFRQHFSPGSSHKNSATCCHISSQSKGVAEKNSQSCGSKLIQFPTEIRQCNLEILRAGAAKITGHRDKSNHPVIVIDPKRLPSNCSVTDFARLLLYFTTVPREDLVSKGFTIILDGREGISDSTAQLLAVALCLLQANLSAEIYQLLVLEKEQHTNIHASLQEHGFKIELLKSQEALIPYIDEEALPADLGGSFFYDHETWIDYRMKIEPFIEQCRSAANHLLSLMQELKGSTSPKSASETNQLIDKHRHYISCTFDDQELTGLQAEGDRIMNELQRITDITPLEQTPDYRDTVERVGMLYREVQKVMVKLSKAAESRIHKLEHCLLVQTFEEEANLLLVWLKNQASIQLEKHHNAVVDNLRDARTREQEFEKFYFVAMEQIAKGSDLIEESAMVVQSAGQTEKAAQVQDLCRELKREMRLFSSRLEEARENVENTSKCYKLLDKSYEWALHAMKFVSGMKMEVNSASSEGLANLSKSLKLYLEENPPVSSDTFDLMSHLANKLKREKLTEQCKSARARCKETEQLIGIRQATLLRAKEHLENESSAHSLRRSKEMSKSITSIESICDDSLPQPSSLDDSSCYPKYTSTPDFYRLEQRRRSFAGLPSQKLVIPPPYGPFSPALRENISEIDEELFNEGLITEDLSVVTTNIPESVLQSRSEIRAGAKSDPPQPKVATEAPPAPKTKRRPFKKIMKRANSWQLGMADSDKLSEALLKLQRSKTSVKSLHHDGERRDSLPEEVLPGTDKCNGNRKMSLEEPTQASTNNCHSNVKVSNSIADFRLSEDELKSKRTLQLVMTEMVQTEQDYVSSLSYIIQNYFQEMEREDLPQELRGKRNVVFGNIEKIFEFHSQYFVNELEQFLEAPFHVGQIFLRYETQFYLYALYNKNKPKSDELLAEYGNTFFRKKQLELGDKMDLASYLLKPVQRMGKYALLLKQVLHECPITDPYYQELKAAEEMVKFQLRHGNDLLAMDAIKEADINIQEQGQLLRQGEFLVFQGRKKCLRHIFLFEDLVLFSKTKRSVSKGGHETYTYKHSMKMTDIGLTETLGDSHTKFEVWFRKRKAGDTYTLQAPNSDVKFAWVRDISKLLWKQALRSRSIRLHEMSSMGIGSRPMLDLKPSQHQINDRSIDMPAALPNGFNGGRFRNSIAVSSFEHLQQQNKRPHSVISVSSTSSSNSSQSAQSFASCGAAGPVGDLEMQRNLLRFLPHLHSASTESGIVADISIMSESSSDTTSENRNSFVLNDIVEQV